MRNKIGLPVDGIVGAADEVDRATGLSMAVSVPNIVTAVAVAVFRGTCEPVCKPKSINSMQQQQHNEIVSFFPFVRSFGNRKMRQLNT